MNQIIIVILTVIMLTGGLGGASYAAYNGYGAAASETESARTGSTRGIFILGGGPGFGGK